MKKIITITLFFSITLFCQAQNNDSIERIDDTSKHLIGLRLSAGIDNVFVPNGQIGINLMMFSNDKTRFSLDNIVGLFIPWLLYERYYYPSIRYHIKLNNFWLSCSYGIEFSRTTDLFDEPGKTVDRIINRCDLSLIYEMNNRYNLEFSIPIRIDDEIPIYLTGLNATVIIKI